MRRREGQIIALMSEGLANKEIAYRLGLTEGTIKAYSSMIFDRHPEMQHSRLGAVRIVARDHERLQAIKLDTWVKKYGDTLSAEALADIREIIASQVCALLK